MDLNMPTPGEGVPKSTPPPCFGSFLIFIPGDDIDIDFIAGVARQNSVPFSITVLLVLYSFLTRKFYPQVEPFLP